MLNMGSTSQDVSAPEAEGPGPGLAAADRTTRARIRDAALRRFAASGVDATSVRTIAGDAGVSPGSVIHHFGSKDALRVACDEHVAALIREQKRTAMAAGAGLDPLAAFRTYEEGPPLLAYLARTLTDGSPHVAELIDEMVRDAVDYMAQGEASGLLRPSEDPHGRAAVLMLWSLGAVVLHEHAERLLGVDLLGDPAATERYSLPAMEILGRGIFTPEADEQLRERVTEAYHDEAGGRS
jgi:AcrR family transcriptional regulator